MPGAAQASLSFHDTMYRLAIAFCSALFLMASPSGATGSPSENSWSLEGEATPITQPAEAAVSAEAAPAAAAEAEVVIIPQPSGQGTTSDVNMSAPPAVASDATPASARGRSRSRDIVARNK